MLPDGLLAQLMPPRCEVLVSAFYDGGTVNSVSFSLLREVGDMRRTHGFSFPEVCASGRLPGHRVSARHPPDDPNLAVTPHPEAALRQWYPAAMNAATRVVSLVQYQTLVSLHIRNCTDDRYGQSNSASKWLILLYMAPRHGFEPRFTAPKAAVLPLDDRGIEMKNCSRPV